MMPLSGYLYPTQFEDFLNAVEILGYLFLGCGFLYLLDAFSSRRKR